MTPQLSDATTTALNNLLYFGLGLAAGLAVTRFLIWVECRATGTRVPRLTTGWWIAVAAAVVLTVVPLLILGASDA